MSPARWAIALVAVIIAIMLLVNASAWAAERPAPDGKWFEGLRAPDTGTSCCNISDCRITEARWMGDEKGHWEARVPKNGGPITKTTPFAVIPDGKILKNKQSPDGEAYVCSGYSGGIFCFVPPSMGY